LIYRGFWCKKTKHIRIQINRQLLAEHSVNTHPRRERVILGVQLGILGMCREAWQLLWRQYPQEARRHSIRAQIVERLQRAGLRLYCIAANSILSESLPFIHAHIYSLIKKGI
jgi:hypothetical protein